MSPVSPEFDDARADPSSGDDLQALDRLKKAPHAYRTISEVADDLHVPQHVLRFWETRFPEVRPLKRGGGRRYYRPEDVGVLRRISELLYVQGYTIKGVQRVLREGESLSPAMPGVSGSASDETDEDALVGAGPDLLMPTVPDMHDVAQEPPVQMPSEPVPDMAALADLERMRHDTARLRAERRALRGQLRDILEELQAIRETLPR